MTVGLIFLASLVFLVLAGVAGNRSSQYEKLHKENHEPDRTRRDHYFLKANTWQSTSGVLLLITFGLWIWGIVSWVS